MINLDNINNKDELAAFVADNKLDIKLDMRKTFEELKTNVSTLTPEKQETKQDVAKPSHVFNRTNGRIFKRTDALESYLSNFFFCDENGNPV